jgi:hypothetical protein
MRAFAEGHVRMIVGKEQPQIAFVIYASTKKSQAERFAILDKAVEKFSREMKENLENNGSSLFEVNEDGTVPWKLEQLINTGEKMYWIKV